MKSQRRKTKGTFSLLKEYVEDAFLYIKDSRNYIYSVIGIFIISAIIGFAFASKLGFLDTLLKEIISKTAGLTGINLILFIFANNASVAFEGLLFGIVLGIFPLINSVSNGLVLGYVLAKVYSLSGFSEFWRILPHGIFELPAIFISLGLGIKLGASVFSKPARKTFKLRLYNSLKVFFLIVLPLLVVAATIEGILIIILR